MRLLCIVLLSVLGAASAFATPVTETELKAPWDKLDLSSHTEEGIFKSVGATREQTSSCHGAMTAGVCWTADVELAHWAAVLKFSSADAAKVMTDDWGSPEEATESFGHKISFWYVRAGKKRFLASLEHNDYPWAEIKIQEMTPLKDTVAASAKLLGKRRDQLASGSGGVLELACAPKAQRCGLDFGVNEVSWIRTRTSVNFGSARASTSVEVELQCGKECRRLAPRLEEAFGEAKTKTCNATGDYYSGEYIVQTFKGLPKGIAWFSAKDPVALTVCFGACDLPCK